MAPEWGRAVRPVVIVYTVISVAIAIAFGADVDAQAGAYATGILAMMVSGAVAISAGRGRQRRQTIAFTVLTLVPLYALVENIREGPDGTAISGLFIAGIIIVSLISRVARTTRAALNLIANRRQAGDAAEYSAKEAEVRAMDPSPGTPT